VFASCEAHCVKEEIKWLGRQEWLGRHSSLERRFEVVRHQRDGAAQRGQQPCGGARGPPAARWRTEGTRLRQGSVPVRGETLQWAPKAPVHPSPEHAVSSSPATQGCLQVPAPGPLWYLCYPPRMRSQQRAVNSR